MLHLIVVTALDQTDCASNIFSVKLIASISSGNPVGMTYWCHFCE